MDFEAEYNNRARVPEHPRIMAGWARDAAAWRAACPRAELDLPYGPGEREKLDLFWPDASAAKVPMAVFIHGGYWQALGRGFVSHCARGLNAQGVAVAVPSYDLCPAVKLDTIVAQMRAAVAMLHRRHGRRLLLAGHSAGGHLAALLLAMDAACAALPISGVFELAPLLHTSIVAGMGLTIEQADSLSPRWHANPGKPIHCAVGGAESTEFIRQSRDMATAWGGTFAALPGLDHFTVLAPLADPDSALVADAKRLAAA